MDIMNWFHIGAVQLGAIVSIMCIILGTHYRSTDRENKAFGVCLLGVVLLGLIYYINRISPFRPLDASVYFPMLIAAGAVYFLFSIVRNSHESQRFSGVVVLNVDDFKRITQYWLERETHRARGIVDVTGINGLTNPERLEFVSSQGARIAICVNSPGWIETWCVSQPNLVGATIRPIHAEKEVWLILKEFCAQADDAIVNNLRRSEQDLRLGVRQK